MKKILTLASAALLIAGSARAADETPKQTIDRQGLLDSLVAAERAFAQMAKEKSTKEAFLANLSDDSFLFGPNLVPGKDLWKKRPESESLLSWYPIHADLSLAGDLGYTTGPWEFRARKDAAEADAYGHFVTIWKKQSDGAWKVMLDLGSTNPKPAGPIQPAIAPAKPAQVAASALPKVAEGQEARNLLSAERAFAAASETKGKVEAYMGVLAEDGRLHRTGRQPVVGREAIRAALSESPTLVTWATAASFVSHSGDLGYTFGLAKRRESGPGSPWVESDNYLRIWKKQADGAWKLILDVFEPRPLREPAEPRKPKEPASGG